MLALWHLFGGAPTASMTQEVQDVVANRSLPKKVNRVALVGIHLSPGAPLVKPDGTKVNTIWGELAWQLGGKKAFDFVAEADASRTNPGEGLRKLITAYSPCLILIDEWVAYARQLWEREDLAGGTFDTQFTFAQSLTEVVKTVSGAMANRAAVLWKLVAQMARRPCKGCKMWSEESQISGDLRAHKNLLRL
jgi:predicted AAA+ superfamily ATPase